MAPFDISPGDFSIKEYDLPAVEAGSPLITNALVYRKPLSRMTLRDQPIGVEIEQMIN